MTKNRNYMIDNLRAVLIFLVVLGHTLEYFDFVERDTLYYFIYSFHMPAFAFVSGLCFHKGSNHVFRRTILPYVIFQYIYLRELAWESGEVFELTFGTPNWILWYLVALAMWQMMTNVLNMKGWLGLIPLVLSLGAALWIGNDPSIGYKLTLSRMIVFFPFFLLGAYIHENGLSEFKGFFCDKKWFLFRGLLLIPAIGMLHLVISQREIMADYYFYGSVAYNDHYTMKVRAMTFVAAVVLTAALCVLVPKIKVPALSQLGQNTMVVYLLHGISLRVLNRLGYLKAWEHLEWLQCLLLTVILVAVLSLPGILVSAVMDRRR